MTSYQKYRIHMNDLTQLKKKLFNIINQKKIKHSIYREAHKEYRKLEIEQDKLTKEIMDIIPDNW